MRVKYLLVVAALFLMAACTSRSNFTIEGNVQNAEGQILYLEHTGLMKNTVLDSVKLKTNGSFKFKVKCPEYPDFYRLRLNNRLIVFAVDSCEQLTVSADSKQFASGYTIEGPPSNLDIQKLRASVAEIQRKVNDLKPGMAMQERNAKLSKIQEDIEIHKKWAKELILRNPRSTEAYFAIYQQVNNTYLFSPYIKEDRPFCAAVATAYHAFMPEYERSKNLYALVMDAVKVERKEKQAQEWSEIVNTAGKGYIDIELNNRQGEPETLSSLEGKVVLIDFSIYESPESVKYTFALRDLYNKYSAKGFEIYQVSLDRNKLLWERSTESIPWVCVRDDNGPNTVYASLYNLNAVPTRFLLDRKGNIVGRDFDFETLDREISKSL